MCWVHRYCQHAGFGFVCICFAIRFSVHAMIYWSKRPIDPLAIQCVHLAYEHQNYKSAQINVFEQLCWRGYEFGKTMHETFWEKGLDRKLIYWINEHDEKQWQSRGRKLIKKFRFSFFFIKLFATLGRLNFSFFGRNGRHVIKPVCSIEFILLFAKLTGNRVNVKNFSSTMMVSLTRDCCKWSRKDGRMAFDPFFSFVYGMFSLDSLCYVRFFLWSCFFAD